MPYIPWQVFDVSAASKELYMITSTAAQHRVSVTCIPRLNLSCALLVVSGHQAREEHISSAASNAWGQ